MGANNELIKALKKATKKQKTLEDQVASYKGYNHETNFKALMWRRDFADEAHFEPNPTPKDEETYMDINMAYATAKNGDEFCGWIGAAISQLKQECLAQIPEKIREDILDAYNREENDIPCFYNFTGHMRNEHYYGVH